MDICMMHDVEKVLLCNSKSQGREYAAWAEHLILGNLEADPGSASNPSGNLRYLWNHLANRCVKGLKASSSLRVKYGL